MKQRRELHISILNLSILRPWKRAGESSVLSPTNYLATAKSKASACAGVERFVASGYLAWIPFANSSASKWRWRDERAAKSERPEANRAARETDCRKLQLACRFASRGHPPFGSRKVAPHSASLPGGVLGPRTRNSSPLR